MQKLEVFSPIGDDTMARKAVASPLDTLDGKTIGEVWNGVYKGTETFPVLRELLQQRFPGLKVIPFTEFPANYGGETRKEQAEAARRIAELAKAKGCDAIITGNGA